MEDLKALFDACVELMQVPFTIYGFTLSWWDIWIWSMIAGLILWFIVRFLYE